MDQGNYSRVAEFVLLGLSSSRELQYFFFVLFNFLYMAIVLGNFLIVLTVISEPALHTPMYIMLSNLSVLDVFLATYATPKMIHDFLHEPKIISFEGCMAQIFLLHVFAGGEMVLLVAMAYDRYVAICKPLHYATVMNLCKCTGLVVSSWVTGVMHSLSQLAFTVNLPFCGPNIVDSYYCDLTLVIKLACTDTYIPEVLMLLDSGLMGMTCFLLLLISYTVILVTVRRHSSVGMAKARSTLTAHITVVTLFFVPCIFIYAWPFSNFPVDKVLSVLSTVFTPVLNPIIYTLRNKEVKSAMHKLKTQYISSWLLSQLSLTKLDLLN
ncbi:olfactory receptor 4K15-like isoform X1 [Diceros bicornis minor]|uniref:olfactory receptor 4K15-like isoform X1 n=1 Tax=Diceros bicornis minor TaxID=77932 RepID=UPI0026F0E6B7|nr:olfactory receptor 4K15-like isoform X1 [Diceros bicornis minor]